MFSKMFTEMLGFFSGGGTLRNKLYNYVKNMQGWIFIFIFHTENVKFKLDRVNCFKLNLGLRFLYRVTHRDETSETTLQIAILSILAIN